MTAEGTLDSYDPHFAAVRHRQRLWWNYAWRTTGRQRSWTVYRRRLQQWFSDTSFRLQHCAPRNRNGEERYRPSGHIHNTLLKIQMLPPPQLAPLQSRTSDLEFAHYLVGKDAANDRQ